MPEEKYFEEITDFERELVTEYYEWKVKCCDNFLYQTDERYREQMDYYTKMCDPEYRRRQKGGDLRAKICLEQRKKSFWQLLFVVSISVFSVLVILASVFFASVGNME